MAIKVYPYKQGSKGAKALAEALGGRVLKKQNSKYRFREGDLIINWGAHDCPYEGPSVVNQPNAISRASNKLECFNALKDKVSIPAYFTNKDDIPDEAFPVMCRTKLQGHSGEGIVVANNRNELVNAPLYTSYVKKKDEYRIHVLRKRNGDVVVVSVQRKAKRNNVENPNFMIRNLANGFVYVRDGVNPPQQVIDEAKKSVEATGLAFGAVDVIWNDYQGKAYVLEINTAPGLEGQTVTDYAAVFKEIA